MDNFDLKKFLVENKLTTNSKLTEAYDISSEVKVGDIFRDSQEDQYEVVSVSSDHVELEPRTFRGNNSRFPEDFGEGTSIGDFWQHFEVVLDEPKGMFGEPGDSDDFSRHLN